MNTRKQGDKLENFIANELNFKKTYGSGSVKHDGDLKDKDNFIIECKQRSQKNLTINKDWITTVEKQANLSNRDWLIINQLEDKSIYVTMNFETFKNLYENFNSK